MKKILGCLFALAFALLAHAQDALVVQTCGTLPQAYSAGSSRLMTVDTTGKLCLSTGTAANITVGTTTVTGGTNGYNLYDNAGVLGVRAATGTASTTELLYSNAGSIDGVSGWTTNGTTALTGGASTTVAIGGATIGSNALAVTGATNLNGFAVLGSAALGAIAPGGLAVAATAFNNSTISLGNIVGGVEVSSDGEFSFSSTTNASSATRDVILKRDAANTLAQRNGTAAQTFRVYNTYTDATNFEAGQLAWVGNALYIGSSKSGTGVARNIAIDSTAAVYFKTGSLDRWQFNSSGHLLAVDDNTYDIGASGATRPRSIYVASNGTFGGAVAAGTNVNAAATGAIYWLTRSNFRSPADGQITLLNNAETDFARLQFGGTTSSFPALKRNAAILETKLADDSAYAQHAALFFQTTTALNTAVDGGSTAAFTANMIGSTGGPTTAAQNGWVLMKDSGGATFWVPAWK